MTRSAGHASGWIVDPHAHLYGGFEVERFLAAAVRNFGRAARALGCGEESAACLLLMDTAGQRGLARLGEEYPRDWILDATEERHSLVLRRPGELPLAVVAGRQVATSEGVEVLAVPASDHFPDGEPVDRTTERVRAAGAVALLPWGVGKWMFSRGRIIERVLSEEGILVVDSGNRPGWLPTPPAIRRAEATGVPVLTGSDPLPLPYQAGRAGGWGVFLPATPDLSHPAAQITSLLAAQSGQPSRYGRSEPLVRFVLSQAAMQLPRSWRSRWESGADR